MKFKSALSSLVGLTWGLLAFAPIIHAKASDDKLKDAAEDLASVLQFGTAFEHPSADQQSRILGAFKNLESLSHAAKTPAAIKSAVDPVMRYVSLDLPAQFRMMQKVYDKGDYAHARYLFKQTNHYCVSCHVILSPKNPGLLPFPAPLKGLSEVERADYFAATRNLKEAMLAYEKALTNRQFIASQPQLWANALENLLGITIITRNDANITLEMTSRILEIGGLTPAQKDLLTTWRSSAKAWTREKLKPRYDGAGMITRAQQLIQQGNNLATKGTNYGYLDYLRAMNMVHELGFKGETEMLKASGFRLAGEVSEKLKTVSVWMYPESYYEACIRALPHSGESRQCWTNYESYRTRERHSLWDADLTKVLRGLAL